MTALGALSRGLFSVGSLGGPWGPLFLEGMFCPRRFTYLQSNSPPSSGYINQSVKTDFISSWDRPWWRERSLQRVALAWIRQCVSRHNPARFFFVQSYSHAAYLDYGGVHFCPGFLSAVRGSGGSLQAPLCPPPRPIPRRCLAQQRE